MKLNHLNLIVSNVAEAVSLFETYFDFVGTEVKGDNVVAVMEGTDGFILVLMAQKEGKSAYPAAFHVGFLLDSEKAVIETYEKLKKGGIEVGREPGKIRDSFGFYFTFDSLLIEVAKLV